MQYADDRTLRETMYRASATRAVRVRQARVGQHAAHRAHRAAAPRDGAAARLPRLRRGLAGAEDGRVAEPGARLPRRPGAPRAALRRAGRRRTARRSPRSELGIDKLEAWDVAYASEKLRAKRYSFSDQEVKQYFPEDAALGGLFRVAERLYGVKIVPAKAPVWHQDVRFFEVRDASGSCIGQFYLDLYARETKRGGAWMDDAITRRRKARPAADPGRLPELQLLAAGRQQAGALHARRSADAVPRVRPRPAPPAHAHRGPRRLRHQRRRVGRGRAAQPVHGELLLGMGRAARNDAARRYGLTPSASTVRPMLAAKNFQSGLAMLRQIEFAVFDMRLHSDFDPATAAARSSCSRKCARRSRCCKPPAYNRFPNSFSHIFAGGYAAGYYSYKWAEVLSADAYSFFEENGMLDAKVGARFRDEILGGRRQPAGGGIVQGLPRPRAERRSPAAPQRDDRGLRPSVTPRARRRPSPLSTIWRSRRG